MSKPNPDNNDTDLFRKIHNCKKSKDPQKIETNDNILIQYLKDPKIIKDKLDLFINELKIQIEKDNNIILPFLDPCYDLVEVYINNNNEINQKIFKDIFKKLKDNSFINRKILIPIYAYFTELYSDVDTLSEYDKKIIMFPKMVKLWKLFYIDCEDKETKNTNLISTFCFLGGGLTFEFGKIPKDNYIQLRINFLNKKFLKFINKNDSLISAGNINIPYSILYDHQNDYISTVDFIFKGIKEKSVVEININNNYNKEISFNTYTKFNILHNFYGQLKSLEISLNEDQKYNILPFPLKDSNILFSFTFLFNNFKIQELKNEKINRIQRLKVELKVENKDLVKVNYINYKEKGFNIIDYFGGITQFLPFLNIINGIYKNTKIKMINNIQKEKFLIKFATNILLIIYNNINASGIKKQSFFSKYWNFFLYILNKIEPFKEENLNIDVNKFSKKNYTKNDEIFFLMFKSFLHFINYPKDTQNEKNLFGFCKKLFLMQGIKI